MKLTELDNYKQHLVYGQIGTGIGNLGAQQFGLQQQGIQSLLGTGNIQRTRDQAIDDEAFRFQTAQGMEQDKEYSFHLTYFQEHLLYNNQSLNSRFLTLIHWLQRLVWVYLHLEV